MKTIYFKPTDVHRGVLAWRVIVDENGAQSEDRSTATSD